jgi:GT2 family glycosyltransferase
MGVQTSLIIPTRNRAEVLRLSLPRFLNQTVPVSDYEIVIVDDASEDDTEAVVKGFAAPNIVYFRQEKRTAAAGARNRAIGLAKGQLLLFVDDDALVRSDFVAEHLATHRRYPHSVVAGPIVECTEPPAEADPAPGWWLGRHSNPFPTGNASVAKSAVLEAGGFDEGFTAYGWEDPEMYRRLIRTGVKRRYNWRAPIWHYKPATHRRDFFQRLELEESRGAMGAYYYDRHPTLSVAFETKQHAAWRALDRMLAPLLGLDTRIAEARRTGIEPSSAFWQLLMVNHVEIDAGRRALERLKQIPKGAEARKRPERKSG